MVSAEYKAHAVAAVDGRALAQSMQRGGANVVGWRVGGPRALQWRGPMRARIAAATLLIFLVAVVPAVAGDPVLPLSQVHAGMRCTGYSVVRGTEVSSFDVEVIDVVSGDP